MGISAFGDFVRILTEFVGSLLPLDLTGVIVAVIGIVIALAIRRVVY